MGVASGERAALSQPGGRIKHVYHSAVPSPLAILLG